MKWKILINYYYIIILIFLIFFQNQLTFKMAGREGRNTKSGRTFFLLFQEGNWQKPGKIYPQNYLYFLKLIIANCN